MKRITATVSGRIQNVGYRARVVSIAKEFEVTGSVQNLSDGRVRITAEGEEDVLDGFLAAIKIKNTLIDVEDVEVEHSDMTGDYADFYKLVGKGETDERLDKASDYLRKLIVVMENGFGAMETGFEGMRNEMKTGFETLGSKGDQTIEEISEMRDEMKTGFETLGSKGDQTIDEIRHMRGDLTSYMDWKFEKISDELEAKFAPEFDEIKRVLMAHGMMDEPEPPRVEDGN
jgi:acylphosphatase